MALANSITLVTGVTIEDGDAQAAGSGNSIPLGTLPDLSSVLVDAVVPTVAIVTAPAYINFDGQSTYQIDGTCSDDGQAVTVSLADTGSATAAPATAPTCTSGAWTATVDVLASSLVEGDITITANYQDLAGNTAAEASMQVTKDVTLPVLALTVGGSSWDWTCSESNCEFRSIVNNSATSTIPTEDFGAGVTRAFPGTLGTHYIHVEARDVAGNLSVVATSAPLTVAGTAPVVSLVIPPAADIYVEGEHIEFTVVFSKAVTVSAGIPPTIGLTVGSAADRVAVYNRPGANPGELIFRYTVVVDDEDSDGVALANSITLVTGVSIEDGDAQAAGSGNSIPLGTLPDLSSVLVDAVVPTVAIVTAPTYINFDGQSTYQIDGTCSDDGQAVTVSLADTGSATTAPATAPTCTSGAWTAMVDVSASSLVEGDITITANHQDLAGNAAIEASTQVTKDTTLPVLTLTIGASSWDWTCSESNCESRSIVNNSAPSTTPTEDFGPAVTQAFSATPGTYYIHVQAQDAAGNLSVVVSSNAPVTVEEEAAIPPVVVSAVAVNPGNTGIGGRLQFNVIFDRAVAVEGTPRLVLSIDEGPAAYANYESGSGSTVLTFGYTVLEGQVAANGPGLGSSSIDPNGGAINDNDDNTLAARLSGLSIAGLDQIRVDGIRPVLVSVAATGDGLFALNEEVAMAATFSKTVTIDDTAQIHFTVGEGTPLSVALASAGSFSYTPAAGQNGTIQVTSITLGMGKYIRDTAVRNPVTALSGLAIDVSNAVVDTTAPIVTLTNDGNNNWSWSCGEINCNFRHAINTNPGYDFSGGEVFGTTASAQAPITSGDYHIHVQADDTAGNRSQIASRSFSIVAVGDAPTIAAVSAVDGDYKQDDVVTLTATFSEAVTVALNGGSVVLDLDVGGTTGLTATYAGSDGASGTTHDFSYTVTSGQNDDNGIEVTGITLSGGATVRSSGDTDLAGSSYTGQTLSGVLVDTTAPVVALTTITTAVTADNLRAFPLSGTCSEDGETVTIVINDAPSLSGPSCQNGAPNHTWQGTVDLSGTAPSGTAAIKVSQVDAAGNIGESAVQTLTISVDLGSRNIALNTLDVGRRYACVVDSGHVKCWGAGGAGQLGYGVSGNRYYAVTVKDSNDNILEQVLQVGGGGTPSGQAAHSCALVGPNGQVWCWGRGDFGRLGNGGTDNSFSAVLAGSGDSSSGYIQLSVGGQHTCALKADGQIWCWGRGTAGRLGNGDTLDKNIPTVVSGGGGYIQVSAGGEHTCALKTDGKVWCWGEGDQGRLGGGISTDTSTPTVVKASADADLGDVIQISSGDEHTCALKSNGQAWCWGEGSSGRLGDGNTTDRSYPVLVVRDNIDTVLGGIVQITSGEQHTCAMLADSTAMCWGNGIYGRLGNAITTAHASYYPTVVREFSGSDSSALSGLSQISAGADTTCAVSDARGILCWGHGSRVGNGMSGTGNNQGVPVAVVTDEDASRTLNVGSYRSSYDCVVGGSSCTVNNIVLALASGTSSPSSSTSPSVEVTGMAAGQTVALFDSNTCDTQLGASATSTSNTVSPTLSTDGRYTIHFQLTESGETGGCSESYLSYILDTTPPAAARYCYRCW